MAHTLARRLRKLKGHLPVRNDMDLKWSEGRETERGGIMHCYAILSLDKHQALFPFYEQHRDEMRAQGFSINKYRENWQLNYFHTIEDNSFQPTKTGKVYWQEDFRLKRLYWSKRMREEKKEAVESAKSATLDGDFLL